MPGLTFNVFGHDVSASRTLHHVEGEAQSASGKIGGHFKKMGSMIAGGFAAAGAVDFLSGSIDEAREAQKVGAQTAAVLKSTGGAAGITAGQVGDLSTAISNKVGIDDEAIQSGANLLLTFTNLKNEAGKGNDIFNQTTQIMTDMSVATGTSMKSSAMQLGKALNDPIKGISKLSKVGVTFTQQQKDQVTAMVKAGNTAGAQKVILKELSKEFGGSAAAQATDADKMKVSFGNLKETVGTYLIPVIDKLARFITEHVIPAIQTVIAWIVKHKNGFITLGHVIKNAVVNTYKNFLKPIIETIIDVVKKIMHWVKEHKAGLLQLAHVVGAVLTNAFKILKGVIKICIDVISWAWRTTASGAKIMWSGLSNVFGWIKSGIRVVRDVIKAVTSVIRGAWRGISDGIKIAWSGIKTVYGWIKSGIRTVKRVITPIINAISDAWQGIGKGLQWAWDHTIGPILDSIMAGIHHVQDAINTLTGGGVHTGGTITIKPPDGTGAGAKPAPVKHNAQGSGWFKGGATWLNELGPEMVTLPSGSQITPASTTASQFGGGATYNLTFNIPNAIMTHGDRQKLGATVIDAINVAGTTGRKIRKTAVSST